MRFMIIYFLLVFASLILIGVFILRQFESYNLSVITRRMDDISSLVISEPVDSMQMLIQTRANLDTGEELFVIDAKTLEIVASTSSYTKLEDLNSKILVQALEGEIGDANTLLGDSLIVKDRVYPNRDRSMLIYIRYNLRNHNMLIAQSQTIIIQAIVISLLLTYIISIVLSRSITDPINELTKKVKLLAKGDFNQVIEVKSDDEIGEFSATFNYLVGEINQHVNQLTSEKNKLETITTNVGEGLIAIDSTGSVLHANLLAQQMLGDVANDGAAVVELANDEVVELGGRFMELKSAFYEEGNGQGRIVAIQDVTERQKLEQMRKDFIANVSHELRTPITVVQSYAESVRDLELDKETENRFLTMIVTESQRMTRLVKDLLYLSVLDSEKIELNLGIYDMNKLVANCVEKLSIKALERGQTIAFSPTGEHLVQVDRDRIEQLLINIISNAMKYSSDNSLVNVSVMSSKTSEDGVAPLAGASVSTVSGKRAREMEEEYVCIAVEDHGQGISKEDLARIFERFYRVDKARSRSMGGTGLGLSIAKGIVEAHGGSIEAQSELGIGTTMTIRIPAFVDTEDFDATM